MLQPLIKCNQTASGILLLACGALCLLPGSEAKSRGLVIEDAKVHNNNGVYQLSAVVDYELTEPVREALTNGVALEFEMEIEILAERDYVWDSVFASVVQRFRLDYHELSRQYVVQNLNTRVTDTFPGLSAALAHMGTVSNFPVIDSALLDPSGAYWGQLRVTLALDQLPLPIRARAYLSSAWRLGSDWYNWKLP
ncbi:MAG: DUF4390 domain-containing protein [Gammaproteobacteria bacterium]